MSFLEGVGLDCGRGGLDKRVGWTGVWEGKKLGKSWRGLAKLERSGAGPIRIK